MASTLPDLGRGKLTARKLWGVSAIPHKIAENADDIIAGNVAALTVDANGNPVVKKYGASDNPIGIFFGHRCLYFYVPVKNLEVEITTTSGTITVQPYVKNGSVAVLDVLHNNNDKYDASHSDLDHGRIAYASAVLQNGKGKLLVSYLYRDPNESGFDSTLGTGMITVLRGRGEIATTIYDTSKSYVVGDKLYVNANGMLTSDSSGGNKEIGIITKAPTYQNPELVFEMK